MSNGDIAASESAEAIGLDRVAIVRTVSGSRGGHLLTHGDAEGGHKRASLGAEAEVSYFNTNHIQLLRQSNAIDLGCHPILYEHRTKSSAC